MEGSWDTSFSTQKKEEQRSILLINCLPHKNIAFTLLVVKEITTM